MYYSGLRRCGFVVSCLLAATTATPISGYARSRSSMTISGNTTNFMSSLQERDRYNYEGLHETPYQLQTLNQAYSDAITLALLALNPPSTISPDTANQIYEKYFPQADKATVMKVYETIIGGNTHTGNAKFGQVTVDLEDSKRVCPPPGHGYYTSTDAQYYITICPDFWNGAFTELPYCSAAAVDSISSQQMMIPGSSMLIMFVYVSCHPPISSGSNRYTSIH